MSSGNRYKWHGSQVQIMVGLEGAPSSHVITSISQAEQAVVSATAHGLETGDVVEITGVVGMVEVNDNLFVVDVINANSFSLVDTNSTGYGAYVSGGNFDAATFSDFCELTNYNRQGGTSPELPATTICSEAQEFEGGLADFGTTQLDFNFAPQTSTVQGALHDAYIAGDPIAVRVILPKNGGNMVLEGFVQQESEQAGNGTLWTASATIRNTGNRFDYLSA